MGTCLFCQSEGPYTREEHIIPEALGNDDLLLVGEVCDKCNQYFGTEVERFVLAKTPLAFWRVFLGIRTKHGKLPHVELSQPKRQRGRLPRVHRLHDDLVGFTCHEDYTVSVDIEDPQIVREIIEGTRTRLTSVLTPLVLSMLGRFLCKVGVELLCSTDGRRARSAAFDAARRFARFGQGASLWPIFHGTCGSLHALKRRFQVGDEIHEEVLCYSYRILKAGPYDLLALTVGTDSWVVGLNDAYPTPAIRECLQDSTPLELLWYPEEEVARSHDVAANDQPEMKPAPNRPTDRSTN